jgi:two-component system, OmpR family, sensor histidine kinase KdpD
VFLARGGRLSTVELDTAGSRRRVVGATAGVLCVVAATAVLLPFRDDVTSATPGLILVLPCVVAALMGGRTAGLVVAVVAAGAFNLVFLEPYGTFKIASVDELVAFVVLAVVAFTVATLVAREGERRRAAVQRTAEVEALWRTNAQMHAEQARLAAEMQTLAAIDVQRAALLRSVSHDLRTPLAAIRAVVSDLRDGVAYDAAARDDLLELVADEAERLDRLVQNLLSMSRIEAGSLQPARQAVPIDELLDDRVRRLAQLLRDTTVIVDAPPDLPLVSADYTMVEQVVTNLLENASRHSPPHAEIVVSAKPRGDFVAVSVTDQGPGLDPTDVERLFRPFERGAESRSVGLGLAICRAIVEAHGGKIAVESANGDGSRSSGARFTFTLPVHRG